MDVKTYRAPTMQEALARVRQELGATAVILRTREVGGSRLLRWIPGVRQIEVEAALDVNVPSRIPAGPAPSEPNAADSTTRKPAKAASASQASPASPSSPAKPTANHSAN